MSFTYKGISSDIMGLNITERTVYNAPAYDLNAVEVPGRSGDILNPQNRFKNKRIQYTGYVRSAAFSGATPQEKLSNALIALKGWLCSDAGLYNELTDDYDPGFTRRAYIDGETAIEEVQRNSFGATVQVTFMTEPFMFAPDATQAIDRGAVLINPYPFPALPLLTMTIESFGLFRIDNSAGRKEWEIPLYTGTLYCDSEVMDWYDSEQLQNNIVRGSGFPVLLPGENTIDYTGGLRSIIISPRWRTL